MRTFFIIFSFFRGRVDSPATFVRTRKQQKEKGRWKSDPTRLLYHNQAHFVNDFLPLPRFSCTLHKYICLHLWNIPTCFFRNPMLYYRHKGKQKQRPPLPRKHAQVKNIFIWTIALKRLNWARVSQSNKMGNFLNSLMCKPKTKQIQHKSFPLQGNKWEKMFW